MDPRGSGAIHQRGIDIDPHGLATGSEKQTARQLPNKAKPDYRDPFADAGFCLSDSMQGDTANGGKCPRFKRDRVRKRDAQIHRNVVELGMNGVPATCARHASPGQKIADPGARLKHDPRTRVTHRGRLVKPGADRIERCFEAVPSRLVDRCTCLIWTGSCFTDKTTTRGLDRAAFCPCTQKTGAHIDDDAIWSHRRSWHFHYLDLAVPQFLSYLFHEPAEII